MKRIGIFGGTFDPPHIGHQILAAEALDQLDLDKVLWVLTPNPPHKSGDRITSSTIRLNMVEAAIENCLDFEISRVEINRPAPHYAVDTMRLLSEEYQQAGLIYLMGGDSLKDLPEWQDCKEFVNLCHAIGVMRRPGKEINLTLLETQIPGIKQKIRFFDTPLVDIAASQIRHRIKNNQTYRFYLPQSVYHFIRQHNIYK